MTGERILLDIKAGVAAITLNRPSTGNAIDLELSRQLMHAMRRLEKERGVRVITIKGSGKLFCSGGDLAAISGAGAGASAYARELLTDLHEALSTMARIPIPIVAAIHGAAAGAGLSLACACDLAIATKSSRFVMAYSKVGVTPDGSSSWYLPRLIGLRRALQLSLLNSELTADQALAWGLLNDVVADDGLDTALAQISDRLANGPTGALGGAKRLMRASFDNPLEAQLVLEMQTICAALETEDGKEGLNAFLARRSPKFGR